MFRSRLRSFRPRPWSHRGWSVPDRTCTSATAPTIPAGGGSPVGAESQRSSRRCTAWRAARRDGSRRGSGSAVVLSPSPLASTATRGLGVRHAWAQWEVDAMATMHKAIKEALEQSEGALSKEAIRQFVDERHPGVWQPSTLTTDLYACAINNPKSYIHHPYAKRFLYRCADGTFELYDERSHGPNIWAPDEAEDIEEAARVVPHPVSWTHVCATRHGVARIAGALRVACDTPASRGASTGCSVRRTRRRPRAPRQGFERPGRRRLAP